MVAYAALIADTASSSDWKNVAVLKELGGTLVRKLSSHPDADRTSTTTTAIAPRVLPMAVFGEVNGMTIGV
jgi:hypothetical protein